MTSTLDNALFLSRDDCLIAITQCLLSFMERNLLHNLIKLFHVFCRLLHFRSPYFESDDVVQVIFSKVLFKSPFYGLFQRQQLKTLLRKRAFSVANYFQWKVAKVCSKSR